MIIDKLQNIYNKLYSLLLQFRNINVASLISLPTQINNILVGENQVLCLIDGDVQEITEDDLNGITEIPNYTWNERQSLTNVTIPDSVTTIGNGAFCGCKRLTNVTIPDSVITIGNNAFYDWFYNEHPIIRCNKGSTAATYAISNDCPYVYIDGTDEESIFNGETEEISWAFNKKTGILEISGAGNTSADSYPWRDYRMYVISVVINDNITSIGESMFSLYPHLTNVTIPDSVTSIGRYAFKDCHELRGITIPDGVTIIGDWAFSVCESLTNMSIPDSVTSIGNNAFIYCSDLTDIYLRPTTPPTLNNTSAIPTTTTIHVPMGCGDAYKSATNWSSFSDNIVEDIEI